MDLHQLNAFIAVAEELNFRKASERLGMSQPPLTRLITKLEHNLSAKLFLRTTRKVELTGAGIVLLAEARTILEKVLQTESRVRKVGKMKRGSLSVALTFRAFYSELPKMLHRFKERFSQVDVQLTQAMPVQILKELKASKVDLIFCETVPAGDEYRSQVVHSELLGVLLPNTHPLSKKGLISIHDLQDETFILHERKEDPQFHDQLVGFLKANQLRFSVRYRKRGENCSVLTATEQGLLLATRETSTHHLQNTRFVAFREAAPELQTYAVWRKDAESIELRSFLSLMSEEKFVRDDAQKCFLG